MFFKLILGSLHAGIDMRGHHLRPVLPRPARPAPFAGRYTARLRSARRSAADGGGRDDGGGDGEKLRFIRSP